MVINSFGCLPYIQLTFYPAVNRVEAFNFDPMVSRVVIEAHAATWSDAELKR